MTLIPIFEFLALIGFSVCHQLPERSIHLLGYQMPMCARCTGVHLGFLSTMVWLRLNGKHRAAKFPKNNVLFLIVLMVIPYYLDSVLSYAGLIGTNNMNRLAVGLLFGSALPLLLVPIANIQMGIGDDRVSTGSSIPAVLPIYIMLGTLFIMLSPPLSLGIFTVLSALSLIGLVVTFHTLFLPLLSLTVDKNGIKTRERDYKLLVLSFTLCFLVLTSVFHKLLEFAAY